MFSHTSSALPNMHYCQTVWQTNNIQFCLLHNCLLINVMLLDLHMTLRDLLEVAFDFEHIPISISVKVALPSHYNF